MDDNPNRKIMVGANLLSAIENDLVKCLRANVDLFKCSPKEMSEIDHNVVRHKLNVNPKTMSVSQKRHHQSPEKAYAANEIVEGANYIYNVMPFGLQNVGAT